MAPTKDFYAVLGVASSSTQDEIKKQYRRLAAKHHPDKNPNDPKAADTFKGISEAYQTLGAAASEHRREEIAQTADPSDVEVLESEILVAHAAGAALAWSGSPAGWTWS